MAVYATVQDVAARWQPLTPAQTTIATTLLADASLILREDVAHLDDRIADGTLDPALVTMVCAQMVIRVLRNPDGAKQQAETTGPYTSSTTYDPTLAAGLLMLTPDEQDRLAPTPQGTGVGVGSIRLGAGLGYGRNGIRRDRLATGDLRRGRGWDRVGRW